MTPERTNSVGKYGNARRLKKSVPFAPLSSIAKTVIINYVIRHLRERYILWSKNDILYYKI